MVEGGNATGSVTDWSYDTLPVVEWKIKVPSRQHLTFSVIYQSVCFTLKLCLSFCLKASDSSKLAASLLISSVTFLNGSCRSVSAIIFCFHYPRDALALTLLSPPARFPPSGVLRAGPITRLLFAGPRQCEVTCDKEFGTQHK